RPGLRRSRARAARADRSSRRSRHRRRGGRTRHRRAHLRRRSPQEGPGPRARRVAACPPPRRAPAGRRDLDIAGAAAARDIAARTYAGDPRKKGLDRVLAAWRRARRPGERLLVVGIARPALRAAGFELPDPEIEVTGPLAPAELRRLLRRTRVFLCAPRREDYGLVQLEALAEGCLLVTNPAPGPYVALAIAHELDPRL